MDARASDRETTTTIIEFRGHLFRSNLFSASAIIQTNVGARRMPSKSKRRTMAAVKPGKNVFYNDPQPYLATLPQLRPAESTDLLQDQLSLEIQQMQEEARRSHHQRLEHRTDRESLKILEAFEQSKAEKMASNDRQSLALLEDATTKLRNKMTHCTPPFQPTLWQRPTRVTASQSSKDKGGPLRNHANKQRAPFGEENSPRSIGSSYAVLSPVRTAHESSDSKPESSPEPLNNESGSAKQGLKYNILQNTGSSRHIHPPDLSAAKPDSSTAAEQKITNWLQTLSSTATRDNERANIETPKTTSNHSSPSTQSLSSLNMEDSNSQALPCDSDDKEEKEAEIASLQSFDIVTKSGSETGKTSNHEDERSHVAGSTAQEVELTMPNMRGDGSVADERENQQDADVREEEDGEWIDVAEELQESEEQHQ